MYCTNCGRKCKTISKDIGVYPHRPLYQVTSACCESTPVDQRCEVETDVILELCGILEQENDRLLSSLDILNIANKTLRDKTEALDKSCGT